MHRCCGHSGFSSVYSMSITKSTVFVHSANCRSYLNSISQAGTRVTAVHTVIKSAHDWDCCAMTLFHRLQPEYAYRGVSAYLVNGDLAKMSFQM